jgi:hypothetical protein
MYYDYQDERIALDNRMGQKKDGTPKKKAPERDDAYLLTLLARRDELDALCKGIEKEVAKLVKQTPLWKEFLVNVNGVGIMMAAVILSEIDIHKATTISKIWQFSGMNPGMVIGKQWKRVRGKKKVVTTDTLIRGDKKTKDFLRPYNEFLKAKLLGVLGPEFIKCRGENEYRALYYNMKHRLEEKNWGEDAKNPSDKNHPKANHQHKAANRYMVKMFLQDLYVAWRTLEDLPVRVPYQEEYLGHKHEVA